MNKLKVFCNCHRAYEPDMLGEVITVFTLIPTIQVLPSKESAPETKVITNDNGMHHLEKTGKTITTLYLPILFRFLLWEIVLTVIHTTIK
jgi:hypothetical protein